MFSFIIAYIKVKSPDTSSSLITPPATTSTPINWINKWNNQQFHVSLGKLLFQEQTNNIILIICY